MSWTAKLKKRCYRVKVWYDDGECEGIQSSFTVSAVSVNAAQAMEIAKILYPERTVTSVVVESQP